MGCPKSRENRSGLAEGDKRVHNLSGQGGPGLMRETEKIHPIYFLFGVENYLIEEEING